jgi:hypothetical protein
MQRENCPALDLGDISGIELDGIHPPAVDDDWSSFGPVVVMIGDLDGAEVLPQPDFATNRTRRPTGLTRRSSSAGEAKKSLWWAILDSNQ